MHFNLPMSICIFRHSALIHLGPTFSIGLEMSSLFLVVIILHVFFFFKFMFPSWGFFLAVCMHFECLELLWFHILIIVIVLMCAWPKHFLFRFIFSQMETQNSGFSWFFFTNMVHWYRVGNMIKTRKIKSCQIR